MSFVKDLIQQTHLPLPLLFSPDYNIERVLKSVCALLNGEGGRGGIGPNLTDDYWINHEQNEDLFLNIYDIVYNGAPHNPQMRPFGQRKELSGLAIEKVASYVYYINQVEKTLTEADGAAAPKGDLVEKWKQK